MKGKKPSDLLLQKTFQAFQQYFLVSFTVLRCHTVFNIQIFFTFLAKWKILQYPIQNNKIKIAFLFYS